MVLMEEGWGEGGKVKRIVLAIDDDFPYFDPGKVYLGWCGSWTRKATCQASTRDSSIVLTARMSRKLLKLFQQKGFET